MMFIVFIDYRREGNVSRAHASKQTNVLVMIDHRCGWVFLSLALALQVYGGTLFT